MTADLVSKSSAATPLLGGKELPVKSPISRMVFLGFVVALPSILNGMTSVFSAIALPQMQLSIDEASWFGSISSIGFIVFSISLGFVMDRFGRRLTLLLNIIPPIFGWFLISLDSSLPVLFIGKFLTGCICMFPGVVYVGETIAVNHHRIRSSFIVSLGIGNALGILITYSLGRLLPYKTVALTASVTSALSFLSILIFIPESPHWLHNLGHVEKAKIAEERLRIQQPSLCIIPEIGETQPNISNWGVWIQKLKRKNVYKPMIIFTIWCILNGFNGGSVLGAYMVDIISLSPRTAVTDTLNTSGYNLSIGSGVMVLFAVILTCLIVPRTGIKRLFFISSIGMTFGLILLGISLQLAKLKEIGWFWNHAHVFAVWCAIFFDGLGVATIPLMAAGEAFPLDARGFSSVPYICSNLAVAMALKLHLYLLSWLDANLYFWYAFVTVITVGFVQFFVYETVGKSLEEIGAQFSI